MLDVLWHDFIFSYNLLSTFIFNSVSWISACEAKILAYVNWLIYFFYHQLFIGIYLSAIAALLVKLVCMQVVIKIESSD